MTTPLIAEVGFGTGILIVVGIAAVAYGAWLYARKQKWL